MLRALKHQWRDLKRGRPGHRFQDHYRKRHESRSNGLRKALFLGAGALIVAAGIFFLPAPGPGFLIIFVGGGFMAQESLTVARLLDWCERHIRAALKVIVGVWTRASLPVRAAITLLVLVLAGGAGFVVYELLAQ